MSKPLTPAEQYTADIASGALKPDALQEKLVGSFEALYQQVTQTSWLSALTRKNKTHGIYLYGPVGRGKTMLTDLFVHALPASIQHKRYHYHAFMRHIHQQLHKLQGQENPLQTIARDLKQQFQVLFLDEFYVHDMGNAMILKDTLHALFKENIILLTTSNCAPKDLYEKGMFRERFIPAIESIETNLTVLSLVSDNDYRLDHGKLSDIFITPDDAPSDAILAKQFDTYTAGQKITDKPITCLKREIQIIKRSETVLWCDFNQICSVPRSQDDYLELSKTMDTFIVSHVPIFGERDEAQSIFFTMLVDVLYDTHKRLIVSAKAPLDQLFPKSGSMLKAFQRTYSRLKEMQSPEYLSD